MIFVAFLFSVNGAHTVQNGILKVYKWKRNVSKQIMLKVMKTTQTS